MDPMSIVDDTERTRFCPQTDRRTDGQGDTSIPPFNFVEAEGITKKLKNVPSHDVIKLSFYIQDMSEQVCLCMCTYGQIVFQDKTRFLVFDD